MAKLDFYFLIFVQLIYFTQEKCLDFDVELIYKWVSVEFNWPNETTKQEYIDTGKYIPANNAVNGIKVYKGHVYLTFPRLKPGVAASLTVVDSSSISPVVTPYPNWEMHKLGDCSTLQLVQSMEIDPNTGWMWILDSAYVPHNPVEVQNGCSPKLVIWDINANREIHRYVFPKTVVMDPFYLNDLVLDYGTGNVSHVYISDTLGSKLIVYNYEEDNSYSFSHESLKADRKFANITISGESSMAPLGVNGIAMSADYQFVYYCPLSSMSLYRITTSALRDQNTDFSSAVTLVGNKTIQSDGLFHGKGNSLYLSTLGKNGVYEWNTKSNAMRKIVTESRMQWIDSLAIDNNGYLWFTSNNLHTFIGNDTAPGVDNYFVWRVYVDDMSYLSNPHLMQPKYTCKNQQSTGEFETNLVYKWVTVDYEWPKCSTKKTWLENGSFIPQNNKINGIEVFNGKVYVTIPRLVTGVVVSLASVVDNGIDDPYLRPYPSWEMHTFGDCNKIQFVQSVEVDPNTGYMWILDTAWKPIRDVQVADKCPAKIIVYDILKDKEIDRHVFPSSLTNTLYHFNDLVLDYINGSVKFVYISDTLDKKLVVYDVANNRSYKIVHSSMFPDMDYAYMNISGTTMGPIPLGINGIAMSPDFRYVYYSVTAGKMLYQIDTSILRRNDSTMQEINNSVREVGDKGIQSDGLICGKKGLYYTTLGQNAVYKWDFIEDKKTSGSYSNISLKSKIKVTENCLMQWVDSLALDASKNMWFVTNNLQTIFGNSTQSGKYNFFIWRSKVDDKSYLDFRSGPMPLSMASHCAVNFVVTIFLCLFIVSL